VHLVCAVVFPSFDFDFWSGSELCCSCSHDQSPRPKIFPAEPKCVGKVVSPSLLWPYLFVLLLLGF
jgi:hypothetical protein